jgi:small subunit ribosomal protein S6
LTVLYKIVLFAFVCRQWEGIYVLYTYAARRQTARTVQLNLSTPEVGSENVLLRHITMCKY